MQASYVASVVASWSRIVMGSFPYTGKSEYCYSNSLHMALSSWAPQPGSIPEPTFIECLTTMPFGDFLLDTGEESVFFFSPASVNPDSGLDRALLALGWACDTWAGDGTVKDEDAIRRLRAAVVTGPALVGPIDLGYLSYNPRSAELRGGDHFVVVLSADDEVVFHDPYGYPYARLPTEDFLSAWRAEAIPYKQGPYTIRSNFRVSQARSRSQAIERTMPLLAETMSSNPGGPEAYGGPEAVRNLSRVLRGTPPKSLREILVNFSLPLGARRRADASRFVRDAGREAAAVRLDSQARLLGGAQLRAAKERWNEVALTIEDFAESESALVDELS